MTQQAFIRKGKLLRSRVEFLSDGVRSDCLRSQNVSLQGNVLRAQHGWTVFNDKQKYTRFYEDYGSGLIASTGEQLVKIDNSGAVTPYTFRSPVEPFVRVKYRDWIFGTTANTGTLKLNKGNSYPYWSTRMDSLAVAGERIFGVYDSTLYFSNVSENFSDSAMQTVKLPSRCTALAAYGGVLYILGKTCYKLVPSAENTDIKFSALYDGLADVLPDTVAVVGEKVVFATANGLYYIANGKVKRVFDGVASVLRLDNMRAYALDNYYVALCTLSNGAKTALMLDVNNGKTAGVLADVADIIKYRNMVLAVKTDGIIYRLDDTYADTVRFERAVDFDFSGPKFLRKMVIKTKFPAEVYITADNVTRLYKVRGKRGIQTLPVSGCGNSFTVKISSSGETAVDVLELIAETYGEI